MQGMHREFPGSPAFRTFHFHCRGTGQLLVEELRLCKQCGETRKKKRKIQSERQRPFFSLLLRPDTWDRLGNTQWMLEIFRNLKTRAHDILLQVFPGLGFSPHVGGQLLGDKAGSKNLWLTGTLEEGSQSNNIPPSLSPFCLMVFQSFSLAKHKRKPESSRATEMVHRNQPQGKEQGR